MTDLSRNLESLRALQAQLGPKFLKAPMPIRFSRYVEVKNNGCWVWTGQRSVLGYGLIFVNRKSMLAHRASILIFSGKEAGDDVCHKCDNPSCVNPDHLVVASHDWNMKDMASKKRGNSGYRGITKCKRGHLFSVENTWLDKRGYRWCRTCDKIKKAKQRLNLKKQQQ